MGRSLFTDLSLSLSTKKYGLVGSNGVGKTTLAKIIAGQISPSHGFVTKDCQIHFLAQAESTKNITLAEYLLDIWEKKFLHIELIDRLVGELDFSRQLNQLSGGELMRARLAKLLANGEAFLILDEPSNSLDREGREIVKDLIKTYSGGLLLISHDRELLEEIDSIIELSNQGISIYGGNFTFYQQARKDERTRQEENLTKLKQLAKQTEQETQKRRERQEKKTHHGKKRAERFGTSRLLVGGMKRSAQKTIGSLCKDSKERVSESMSQVKESWTNLKVDPFLRLDFEGANVPAGKTVLSLNQLNWQFSNSDTPLWNSAVNFHLQGPQRWQILGKNGSGKSTLVKLIVDPKLIGNGIMSGERKIGSTSIAYLDQKYGLLDPESSIFEQLQFNTRYSHIELRNELAFYGFTDRSVFQKIKTLSGGELLRASLAHMFLGEKIPELLILDEPTNNLDLASIELLETAVSYFCGAVIVISHDQEFVDNLEAEYTLSL